MHAFFNDWYTAVNNAAGTPASSIIDAIVQEVDPEVKTKFLLGDVLSALSAGLAFVSVLGAFTSFRNPSKLRGNVARALCPRDLSRRSILGSELYH